MKYALSLFLASLVFAGTARGDVITKRDGTRLSGKIVEETPTIITLQSNFGEMVVRQKIATADIKEITRDIKVEATYCRIPIEGKIGGEVKADALDKAFTRARATGAKYIVLSFDSGGGSISEMEKCIDVIKKNSDVPIIAHVKEAGSAAAIMAMACRTIVIARDGSIGAAVPWEVGPTGTPQAVENKFFSMIEATCKAAAEFAGHSPLLVRAMMEDGLVLSQTTDKDGKLEIIEGEIDGARVIKRKGSILTLVGQEAVDAGLAIGMANDLGKSPGVVGVKSWESVGDSVWQFMKSQGKAGSSREQLIAHVGELQAKLEQAKNADAQSLEKAKKLDEQARADIDAVEAAYKKAMTDQVAPSESAQYIAKARETRTKSMTGLREKYQPQLDKLTKQHEASLITITALTAEIDYLQHALKGG